MISRRSIQRTVRRAAGAVLALAIAPSMSACTAVLGFEDAVDLRDASDLRDRDGDGALADDGAIDGAAQDDATDTGDARTAIDSALRDTGAIDADPDADVDAKPDADMDASDASDAEAGTCAETCIAAPPPKWTGPLALFEGGGDPPAPAAPPCAGAYDTDVYDGLASPVAPAATCSCSCSTPAGVTCSSPTASYFNDPSCAHGCGTANQTVGSSCTAFGTTGCGGSPRAIVASTPSGGTCVPSATISRTPPTWAGNARLCAASTAPAQTGCNAGRVCAPAPRAPYESTYCIERTGSWACPAAYPALRTYYASGTDSRSCTACGCGAAAGSACNAGTIDTYTSNLCLSSTTPLTVSSSCTPLGSAKGAVWNGKATASGGACPTTGGQPTGAFAPAQATTICCTP